MDPSSDTTNIQSQVLQTTLASISSSRAAANRDDQQPPPADCCVICLEEISEPSTSQPCGHSNFDFVCLANWLAVDPKCPLCKAPVRQVRYNRDKTYTVPAKPVAPAKPTPSSSRQRTSQHYLLHHSRRRRPRHPAPPPPPPTQSEALLLRRRIYTHNLYSLHIGSNPLSRYRSGPLPRDFAADATLVSRARTFIRRELQVFTFLSGEGRANNAEFLLEYTVAILKTVDMQGAAGQAEEMLADFLGRDAARLFLHELRAWLRSPCGTLEAWDRGVQYPAVGGKEMARGRGEEEEAGGEGGRDGRRRKGDYYRPGGRRYEPYRRRGGGERVGTRGCG